MNNQVGSWWLCRLAAASVLLSPDEVGAVTAEGWLLEEACRELVVLHFHDPLVL